MFRLILTIICLSLLGVSLKAETLPKIEREFRAVWVATVDNVDFPTRKNLSVDEQKAEILKMLDLARDLKLNTVIFQVRPMCDAVYNSKIEPWSEFLTGEMGKAQNFDPLQFVIEEAHRRGILVHAWFNPYRAMHPAAKTVSDNHISRRRPDLVRSYGKYLWLDPSEKDVQDYSLSVVADVVRRYDVDGVHFDDYFYPYPEKDAAGNKIEFPDEKNWQEYLRAGAEMSRISGIRRIPLSRDDWRRANVNDFIEAVGREIKKIKPHVLYGVSPFGIWQPLPEKNIAGFNAYAELYADARKWLQDGTVDYLTPQLYWETSRENLSFPVLLEWWQSQNVKNRHLWAGIGTYRINSKPEFPAQEIIDQIEASRRIEPAAGNIQFSFKSLRNDLGNVQELLKSGVYKRDALIPESNWIKTERCAAPKVTIKKDAGKISINWREQGKTKAFWFVVYAKDKNGWSYSILPAATHNITLSADRQISQIAVTSVDRLGNESQIKQTKP
jgi:uncharacterized lipoprotein YddW (UPF0748 family)